MELEKSLPAAQMKEETIPVIRRIEETLPVNQQNEETLPTIRQTEETLPRVHPSQANSHKVSTKLFNGFFHRNFVEDDKKSEQWQKKEYVVSGLVARIQSTQ